MRDKAAELQHELKERQQQGHPRGSSAVHQRSALGKQEGHQQQQLSQDRPSVDDGELGSQVGMPPARGACRSAGTP